MSIAFLANNRNPRRHGSDPAFIYRCENLSHAVQAKGFATVATHRRLWRGDAELVVIHRPRVSFGLWRLVRRLRQGGARLIADFDDLVFDEAYAPFSPAVRNGISPLWLLRRRFREHRAAAKWFDHITVSTEPLRTHAQRSFPGRPVTVIHNAVHWDWRRQPQPIRIDDPGVRRRVISYMPGTRSHDRDFASIAEPLARFLRNQPDVCLAVTGPLNIRLDIPETQIVHRDKVPFASFARQFAGVWVNLAPLEETPFNRCKSALKALEAGYWGIPTVCSPNPDFARFADAGALVATDPDHWYEWLERLLDDHEYARVTEGLRARTLALADVGDQARVFLHQVAGQAG